MLIPPIRADETERLAALYRLQVLDTPPCDELDRITRQVRRLFGVDTVLVSLVDKGRDWFKSKQGEGLTPLESPRDYSFCAHAIAQDSMLVVPDARQDERFCDNPMVTGPSRVVFYAGQPIHTLDGLPIGTLCLVDSRPRQLSEDDRVSLVDFANLVERYFQRIEIIFLERQTTRDLLHSEALFESIFSAARVGIAMVSLDGRWQRVNPRLCDIVGYPEEELLATTFQQVTHPADLQIDLDLVKKLLDGDISSYALEKRYLTRDGNIVWILLNVTLMRDERGEPLHFISIVEDINERKTMEKALLEAKSTLEYKVKERTAELELANLMLEKSQHRLKMVSDNIPALLSYVDADLCYQFANRTYEEWFGLAPDEVVGLSMLELIGDEAFSRAQPYAMRALTGEQVVFENHFQVKKKEMQVQTTLVPDLDPSGHAVGFYLLSMDVTKQKQLEARLLEEATRDSLTNLYNRRAFMLKLNEAIARSRRQRTNIALLFIDLDRFKTLNDTHGHKFGDAVLRAIADILTSHTRATDTVARLAGDEFTIIMEGLDGDPNAPERLARKIQEAVAAVETVAHKPVNLALSIGVALRGHDSTLNADELISYADTAMYADKRRPSASDSPVH
ncbi:diguanylate cyclase [Oryzomicrobium sp.]|uniref:diguanylate cyclase domain-containing protein n=1 Tax=Oryzomicrobium sp. TaxID=1911578 RepID=UPI0025D90B12|nr:diguanylate cyclase [Oryzomicrobium sp.]MCE1244981.1 diguanylate cyclase [Oryzomicrobium sp.]